jgi:catechol 2,3-dioxygenase-like lactoylglutathione lyase family enzyme
MTPALRSHIMCMGWFLRRTARADDLIPFYRDTLGLPVMRGWEPTYFIWTGETFCMELIAEAPPRPERDQDPATAALTPMFRALDLEALLARLGAEGVRLVARSESEDGKEAFVLDTDGQLIGFREAPAGSPKPFDVEARRRRGRGDTYSYGWTQMPGDMQELYALRRRVANMETALAFYAKVLGLAILEQSSSGARLDAGDNFVLELAPGGSMQRLPEKDRTEIANSFVFRVDNFDATVAELEALGVPIVQRLEFNSAHLVYASDPEGQLIGFEERFEPHGYKTWRDPFAEDLEANRRWRAYRMDAARGASMAYARLPRTDPLPE